MWASAWTAASAWLRPRCCNIAISLLTWKHVIAVICWRCPPQAKHRPHLVTIKNGVRKETPSTKKLPDLNLWRNCKETYDFLQHTHKRDLDQGQCMALRQIEGLVRIPSSRIQSQSGRKHAGNIWKNVIDYQIIMENLANLWGFVEPILLLPGNLLTLLLRQEAHILHACRGLAATNNWSSIACICIWEMVKYSLTAETAMHVQTCRVVSPFFSIKTGCSLQHPTIQDQKAPTLQSLWSLRLASPEMWPRCILGPGGMIAQRCFRDDIIGNHFREMGWNGNMGIYWSHRHIQGKNALQTTKRNSKSRFQNFVPKKPASKSFKSIQAAAWLSPLRNALQSKMLFFYCRGKFIDQKSFRCMAPLHKLAMEH